MDKSQALNVFDDAWEELIDYLNPISAFKRLYDTSKELWDRASNDDKWFSLTHNPYITLTIIDLAKKAEVETARRFKINSHNDAGDAFRHCYWSALIAKELGTDIALEFTNGHEAFFDNPPEEKYMDLHNNNIGIEIGESLLTTDEAISNACYNAVRDKKLIY